MKKRTIFLLSLSIILILIGSVGAGVNYAQLRTEQEKTAVSKKVKYDGSKELVLNFKNSANVQLYNSEDDYIYMSKSGLSLGSKQTQNTDWSVEKDKQRTTVTIDNEKHAVDTDLEFLYFDFGSVSDDTIYLSIPKNYTHITINGKNVSLYAEGLTTEEVIIDLNNSTSHGYVNLFNLRGQNVSVKAEKSDIVAEGLMLKGNLSIDTTTGSIRAQDTAAETVRLVSQSGDLFASDTKGTLSLESTDGVISINQAIGEVTAKNDANDIYYHGNKITHPVTIDSVHGDLHLELTESALEKNKIDFSTEYGVVSIFNKNLSSESSYEKKQGNLLIKASSISGDIYLDETDDDDTYYGD